MNRERARELLPIIEAYANGEKIEGRPLSSLNNFTSVGEDNSGLYFCDDVEYRIKPKPREFWINPELMTVWSTKGANNDCIKVREIL